MGCAYNSMGCFIVQLPNVRLIQMARNFRGSRLGRKHGIWSCDNAIYGFAKIPFEFILRPYRVPMSM